MNPLEQLLALVVSRKREIGSRGLPQNDDLALARPVAPPELRGMSRRNFLAALGGTAAGVALAATVDLEHLLWVPGEKTIFIPEPAIEIVEHFNGCFSADWFAREALQLLKENLAVASCFNRQFEARVYPTARIGETVQVRLPVIFEPRPARGRRRAPGPASGPASVPVTLDRFCGVSFDTEYLPPGVSTPEQVRKHFVVPAVSSIAHRMQRDGVNVVAELALPNGADSAVATDHGSGLSVRAVRAFDVTHGRVLTSLSVLGGKA